MTENLKKALQTQKKATQQTELRIQGSLGIPLGGQKVVEVSNRNSFVYVRLRDNQNEVVQAFNNKVAASYDLPVFIQRIGGRYEVLGVNTTRYQNDWNSSAPYLPQHGNVHSFYDGGGADITWIFSRQFMPLLAYPIASSTGTSLFISQYPLLDNNKNWKTVGGTGTPSLLHYIPTGGNDSVMGLLYMDVPSGNPRLIINSGTPVSTLITGASELYPYIPSPTDLSTQIPLAGFRISTGTTNITWNNLYDVRQFLHPIPTGTGGGGGGSSIDTIGFAGLYNGVPLGTGTFLNVRSPSGQGIFTISGSMFDLFITGSTGGGTVNPPVTGTMVIQQEGQTLGSATTLNFTDGLYASISGSVAQILLSGTLSSYVRTGQPTSLSSITGTYWIVPDRIFVTGSLAVFNQGHALIPGIDYVEQYANSGTFQYISTPPTGTYNLSIWGVPVSAINGGGGGGGITDPSPQTWKTDFAWYGGASTGSYPIYNNWNIVTGFGGSFSFVADSAVYNSIGYYVAATPGNGDKIKTTIVLKAGTYKVYCIGFSDSNRGKLDYDLDGNSPFISGQDWYSAGAVKVAVKVGTVVVSTSGKHTLNITVNGKNASSSNFYMILQSIVFVDQAL